MKLIIDIKDEQYKAVQDGWWCGSLYEELKNGIPVDPCGDCISRKAVVNKLDYLCDCLCEYSKKQRSSMCGACKLGSVFDTLDDLPSVTPQPCEDAISRQAVDDAIYDYSRSCDVNYEQIMEFIDKLPSVTPQSKMGHWIEENPPMVERYPFCSECGFVNPFENALNYCPNCGAKMQEVEENDKRTSKS